MAVVEKTVDLIGDEALCNILIEREIPEGFPTDLYDDTVKSLRMQSLYSIIGLISVTLDNVTSMSGECISSCRQLKRISLPKLTAISSSGIRDNPELEELECPKVTTISNYGLANNPKLRRVVLPQVKVIDQGAFYGSGAVTQAEFPRLETINSYGIAAMVLLEQIDLPSIKTIGADFMYANSQCTVVNIGPYITSINANAFKKTSEDLVINLAVAEGAVSGAPWGATGATINYNVPYSGTVPMPED